MKVQEWWIKDKKNNVDLRMKDIPVSIRLEIMKAYKTEEVNKKTDKVKFCVKGKKGTTLVSCSGFSIFELSQRINYFIGILWDVN